MQLDMRNDKTLPQTDSESDYLMVPEFFPGVTGRHVPAQKPMENEPEITRQFTDSEMLLIAKIRSERRLARISHSYPASVADWAGGRHGRSVAGVIG